ncbi:uncharacterized protein Tsen2 [Battus philenor]|uniref:uncharacterized protein Tsen2 n=1 Tax=Battus philenor TaxID=42288 RepID=UPI0035CF9498
MTTLETKSNCQNDDPNNSLLMEFESTLRFPIDSSMHIIFTGYYNGFGVEIRTIDEVTLLYHMGCFGKGSCSRSKPKDAQNIPTLLRKRQFHRRNYWHKKYGNPSANTDSDLFLKDVDKLVAKILHDGEKHLTKDVIDLVSSNEDSANSCEESNTSLSVNSFHNHHKEDIAIVVPNSESEGDDYFANMKPKCCVNKIKLPEKLMLTTQESFFLLYGLGCLQILNSDNKVLSISQCWSLFTNRDKHFLEKYIVYHYFRSKGYIVKPGIKFGGDFLLYKEGPGINHADFVVLIRNNKEKCDWISIFGHLRVACTTVKEILIAEVISPEEKPNLPKDLCKFSVREILLSRNMPVAINDDIE